MFILTIKIKPEDNWEHFQDLLRSKSNYYPNCLDIEELSFTQEVSEEVLLSLSNPSYVINVEILNDNSIGLLDLGYKVSFPCYLTIRQLMINDEEDNLMNKIVGLLAVDK